MREIKFRAWDKEKKEMIFFEGASFCSEYNLLSFEADKVDCLYGREIEYCELMQYTGLKDKNGKEIFEGDILGGYYSDKVVEVKWLKNLAQFHFDGFSPSVSKVIGNIYENPELLNNDSK